MTTADFKKLGIGQLKYFRIIQSTLAGKAYKAIGYTVLHTESEIKYLVKNYGAKWEEYDLYNCEYKNFLEITEDGFKKVFFVATAYVPKYLWLQKYLKGEVQAPYTKTYQLLTDEKLIQKITQKEEKICELEKKLKSIEEENKQLKSELRKYENYRKKIEELKSELNKFQ